MKITAQTIGLLLFLLFVNSLYSQPTNLRLNKATGHPIQYFISLPNNWNTQTKWAVVFVVSDAGKQFKKDAEEFINARKGLPFIIVSPLITTNGNHGYRDSAIYPYSKSVWDTIDKLSTCKFDVEGLQSIMRDIKKNYSGSDKIFITGFEAGAHLVWAMVFQHPELLYAASPVAGNYRNRCIEKNLFSNDLSRIHLPIKNFTGSEDKDFGINGRVYDQYVDAKSLALAHGYKNISETEIKGKGHVPLPENVLEYFNSLWEIIKK